eukprot:gene9302-biopygen1664
MAVCGEPGGHAWTVGHPCTPTSQAELPQTQPAGSTRLASPQTSLAVVQLDWLSKLGQFCRLRQHGQFSEGTDNVIVSSDPASTLCSGPTNPSHSYFPWTCPQVAIVNYCAGEHLPNITMPTVVRGGLLCPPGGGDVRTLVYHVPVTPDIIYVRGSTCLAIC